MDNGLSPASGYVTARLPNQNATEILVAAVTNEGSDFYLMLGEGNHDCSRFKLSESLAKKIRRELNQRLD